MAAITPAVYADCAKTVIQRYNAGPGAGTYPASATDVQDPRRSSNEIRDALVEADGEVLTAIGESSDNGFRNSYVVAVEVEKEDDSLGGLIPEHVGPIGDIEIQVASGDDIWQPGEPAPLSDIKDIIASPAAFGGVAHDEEDSPLGGLYHIEQVQNMIYWTGNALRMYLFRFSLDYATPALSSPVQYTQALIACALRRMPKEGDRYTLVEPYFRVADYYLGLITQGAKSLPKLDKVLRMMGEGRQAA